MTDFIAAGELASLLSGSAPFALIDVRDVGEYNSSHIPGSSLIPRRELEFRMPESVPFVGANIIVCDDDGQRAVLAAGTLTEMGYTDVSTLDGGMNRWVVEHRPTEWGVNVPSKDFGERVQVEHEVPEITATELLERLGNGEKLVILDSRTPEEYQRSCVPGARSVPGTELALRITDITEALDEDTTVVVSCAGRTRSIIGTRILQRMGLRNLYGLENGTAGWALAGQTLEEGADRIELPEPSAEGLAAAEAYAAWIGAEDGVRRLDMDGLAEMMRRRDRENVYLVDVRAGSEYEGGHIPGFQWFPGGQAVQRVDEVAVVHNSPVVFCCDRNARATITASFYRQMGFEEVYVVDGGADAWCASGFALETGDSGRLPSSYDPALRAANFVSPRQLYSNSDSTVLFVDLSQDFARGHVPSAHWIPRGWLELQIDSAAADKQADLTVTCTDGLPSTLAGATLTNLGYRNGRFWMGG
jgi:rhodanese-related sulfurtransferase